MRKNRELLENIYHQMSMIDCAQIDITRIALATAAVVEDKEAGYCIFDLIRERVHDHNDEIYNVDEYLQDVHKIKAIAEITNQAEAASDLGTIIAFLESNRDSVKKVLRGLKKEVLYTSLRDNSLLN